MDEDIPLKGKQYELFTFLLILYNSLKYSKLKFQLGREVKIADKFDDLVIKYEADKEEKYVCCQIKQIDSNEVITEGVLLGLNKISLNEKDFDLIKCFQSYLRIIDQFKDANKVLEKLIYYTNTDLHVDIKISRSSTISNFSKLLEIEPQAEEHFIKFDDNSKICKELLKTRTDFEILVDLLAQCNVDKKIENRMPLDDTCLKYYHTALIDERIVCIKVSKSGYDCKFHEDFRSNKNLSNIAQIFRERVLQKSKKTEILQKTWKVVAKFGLKDLSIDVENEICKDIVRYWSASKQNEFQFEALNENYLSYYYLELIRYHVLEFDENKNVKFHKDFIENVCNKYYERIRENIRKDIKGTESDFRSRLRSISFIPNTNIQYNYFLKPLIKLPAKTNITVKDVENFLNILEFKWNQPSSENLREFFSNEFDTNDIRNYSAQLTERLKSWIKENGQNETWVSNKDVSKLLGGLQKTISLNKAKYITKDFIDSIDKKMEAFKVQFKKSLKGFDNFLSNDARILVISTKQTILTTIKLWQSIKTNYEKFNNQYTFFNCNDIINKNQCKLILEANECSTIKYIFISVEDLTETHRNFIENLTKLHKKLIVVIKAELATEKLSLDEQKIDRIDDNSIKLDSLKDIHEIINYKIKFQGKEVPLSKLFENIDDLVEIVDGNTISKIISNDVIEIGNNVESDKKSTIGYHIERTFTLMDSKNKVDFSGLFETEKQSNLIVISGSGGLGKTSALNAIGQHLKEKYPTKWLIRINLNEFTSKFKSFLSSNEQLDEKFISNLLSIKETEIEYKLISVALQRLGNINILIDAFDEICPDYADLVIKFLRNLQTTCVEKIIVTTRPIVLEKIENGIQQIQIYNLDYLSDENQFRVLKEEFKKKFPNSPIERIETYTEQLLEIHKNVAQYHSRNSTFTNFPLNLKMLSEIYATKTSSFGESCEEFVNGNSEKPKLEHNINFINLFERCIDIKLQKHLEEKNKIDFNIPSNKIFFNVIFEKIYEIHKTIAIETVLDEEKIKKFNLPPLTEKDNIEQCFGLIDGLRDRKPVFLHKIFSEYFAALYILDYLLFKKESIQFYKFIINHCLVEPEFAGIRKFLNNLLERNDQPALKEVSNCSNESLFIAIQESNDFILKYLHHRINVNEISSKYEGSPLHFSARYNLTLYVEELLAKDANPNIKNYVGETPLHLAAQCNSKDVIKQLLDRGADSNVENKFHEIPLLKAIRFSSTDSVKELLMDQNKSEIIEQKTIIKEALRKQNAKIVNLLLYNFPYGKHKSETQKSLLHYAVSKNNVKEVKLLLTNKVSVNEKDSFGHTPLHVAVICEAESVLNILLQHGADVNCQDDNSNTPIHWSISNGNIKFTNILLKSDFNPNITNKKKESYLHLCAKYNFVNIVKQLFDRKADPNLLNENNETPLHVAARYLSVDTVKELLQHEANVDRQNTINKNTPLHIATDYGSIEIVNELLNHSANPNIKNDYKEETPLFIAVKIDSIEIVNKLLEHGANLNTKNVNDESPLHIVARHRSDHSIELLLENNIDLNHQNSIKKNTPLHLAVFYNSTTIVEKLLKNGALPNIQNHKGDTPLHLAARNGSTLIINMLLKHDADRNIKNEDNETPLQISQKCNNKNCEKQLLNFESKISEFPNSDSDIKGIASEIYLAIKTPHVNKIRSLLYPFSFNQSDGLYDDYTINNFKKIEKSINADTKNVECNDPTALHYFSSKNLTRMVEILLEKGISPNYPNKYGHTPLHVAVICGSESVLHMLIKYRADIDCKDKEGNTPLHLAIIHRDKKFTAKILKYDFNPFIENNKGQSYLHLCQKNNWTRIEKIFLKLQKMWIKN